MNVIDVLKNFTTYLDNKDDFAHYLDNDEANASNAEKENFKKFLLALNFSIKYLAGNFQSVCYVQTFSPDDSGKILLSSFSKKLNKIKSVKFSGSNVNVRYKLFDEFLICESRQNVDISYSHFPSDVTSLSGSVSTNGFSEKTLILCVIKEYLFICGLFDDAEIFDDKFQKELKIEKEKLKNVVIPKRNWGI